MGFDPGAVRGAEISQAKGALHSRGCGAGDSSGHCLFISVF